MKEALQRHIEKYKPLIFLLLFFLPIFGLFVFKFYGSSADGMFGYINAMVIGVLTNASFMVPTPSTFPLIIEIAQYHPVVILAGVYGVASALGESTGYLFGNLLQFNPRPLSFWDRCYQLLKRQMQKGKVSTWIALFVLAIQPVFPFDVGGAMAGNAKYPWRLFFLATALGRWLKYFYLIVFWSAINTYFFSHIRFLSATAPYIITAVFFIVLLRTNRKLVLEKAKNLQIRALQVSLSWIIKK